MQNDRELLELAAKAAGYQVHIWGEKGRENCARTDVDVGNRWNPLIDAGDRHRLLIDLKMTLAHEPSRGGWRVGLVVGGDFLWEAFDEDEARAIVRAAAEIGRAMP